MSSTVPGVTDHVVEGVTGYLVPPGSSEELAKKMVAVLEDSSGRSAVGAAALRHAQEQLSWKVIVCQLIKRVYRPLLTSPVLASGPASSWTG